MGWGKKTLVVVVVAVVVVDKHCLLLLNIVCWCCFYCVFCINSGETTQERATRWREVLHIAFSEGQTD